MWRINRDAHLEHDSTTATTTTATAKFTTMDTRISARFAIIIIENGGRGGGRGSRGTWRRRRRRRRRRQEGCNGSERARAGERARTNELWKCGRTNK